MTSTIVLKSSNITDPTTNAVFKYDFPNSVNLVDYGRIFIVKNATNTQGFSNILINQARYASFAGFSLTDSNIDWTVNQYLIISITLLSALEVAKSSGCLLLKD